MGRIYTQEEKDMLASVREHLTALLISLDSITFPADLIVTKNKAGVVVQERYVGSQAKTIVNNVKREAAKLVKSFDDWTRGKL